MSDMSDTPKRKGRPKGRPKKAITIRLDNELYKVLSLFETLVVETIPSARVVDIHEAIFHYFFFVHQGQELKSRPSIEILEYLAEYVDVKELRELERWNFFHEAPSAEQEASFLAQFKERLAATKPEREARLVEIQQRMNDYDASVMLQELERIKARLEALERA
jgi:hypothetical protein